MEKDDGFEKLAISVVLIQAIAIVALGLWLAVSSASRTIDEASCIGERERFVSYLDGSLQMANTLAEQWKLRFANCAQVDPNELASW